MNINVAQMMEVAAKVTTVVAGATIAVVALAMTVVRWTKDYTYLSSCTNSIFIDYMNTL